MDILAKMKEVTPLIGQPIQAFPKWFQDAYLEDGSYFKTLMGEATKEIEDLRVMRESYSRLYKQFYGSS